MSLLFRCLLLLTAISLVACAGDRSGGASEDSSSGRYTSSDSSTSSSSSSTSSSADGALNPQLNGQLFFNKKVDVDDFWQGFVNQAYLMHLANGNYILIANTDWERQDERFPVDKEFAASASDDGTLLVVAGEIEYSGSSTIYTKIAVQDFDGTVVSEFELQDDFVGIPKLSRDNNYIALYRRLAEDWLAIYDTQGNFVSNIQTTRSSLGWMPNGQLVFVYNRRSLVLTEPYSTSYSSDFTLPDTIDEGYISYLSVSPDGTKILFSLITDGTLVSTNGQLWMLDINRNLFRRVAQTPEEDSFTYSAWSPDGEYIMVQEGGFTGSDSSNPGMNPVLYVMPSDKDDVFVVSPDASEKSEGVVVVKGYVSPENTAGDASNRFLISRWGFAWLSE